MEEAKRLLFRGFTTFFFMLSPSREHVQSPFIAESISIVVERSLCRYYTNALHGSRATFILID